MVKAAFNLLILGCFLVVPTLKAACVLSNLIDVLCDSHVCNNSAYQTLPPSSNIDKLIIGALPFYIQYMYM